MRFLSVPPTHHPVSPEGFMLVYRQVGMRWCPEGGVQGEQVSEENRKRGPRRALDRTVIAGGTENNEPLLREHPHSQVLTQGGPEGTKAAPPTGLPTDAGDSEFRLG